MRFDALRTPFLGGGFARNVRLCASANAGEMRAARRAGCQAAAIADEPQHQHAADNVIEVDARKLVLH